MPHFAFTGAIKRNDNLFKKKEKKSVYEWIKEVDL